MDGYVGFANKLHVLFQHLDKITDFSFSATSSGPVGIPGPYHSVLHLHAYDMPFLQVLELRFCFMSKRFAHFIGSHLATLKRVVLSNCYSGAGDGYAEEYTKWRTFFNMISEYIERVDRMCLAEVTISPSVSGVLKDEGDLGNENVDVVAIRGTDEELELAKQTLQDNPGRRFFAYAGICSGGGCLYQAAEENLWEFLRGEDEAAFDRLVDAMRRSRDGIQKSC